MSRIEEAMEKARGKQRPLPEEPDAAPQREGTAVVSPPTTQPALAGRVDEHVVSFHSPRSGLTENFKQIRIMIQNMYQPSLVAVTRLVCSTVPAKLRTAISMKIIK